MSENAGHDAEMQQFMADLEQSIKEAKAGLGRVTTPEQILVRQTRAKTGLTQAEFSKLIATPLATLRDREQGRFTPPGGMLCLLRIINNHPELTKELEAA